MQSKNADNENPFISDAHASDVLTKHDNQIVTGNQPARSMFDQRKAAYIMYKIDTSISQKQNIVLFPYTSFVKTIHILPVSIKIQFEVVPKGILYFTH